MNLFKCPLCKNYTLKEICDKCKEKTRQAGYKFKTYGKEEDGKIL